MEKTIEAAFFKAFELGGIVDLSIDYVQRKYDWGYKHDRNSKRHPLNEAGEFYNVELPNIIKTGFEAFDSSVVYSVTSPLIDEIENNLLECKTNVERDKYIYSLITPFARLSGIIHPTAEIERLTARISENEKAAEMWSKANPDEQLKNTAGEAAGTPREQIEACNREIDRLKWQVERTKEISSQFVNLLCSNQINELWTESGTVEHCLSAMLGTMGIYSNRLFAMLIQHGINLKEYQKTAGVYLKKWWSVTDIANYIGSMELAQHYLDGIKNDEQSQQETPPTAQPLNDEQSRPAQPDIMTDGAKKYFAKAIQAGFMEQTGNGYKWTFGGRKGAKAALCYFIMKVYSPDVRNSKMIHYKALEKLFDEKRLDSAYTATFNVKKPQEWRGEIDSLFND